MLLLQYFFRQGFLNLRGGTLYKQSQRYPDHHND